MVPDRYGIGLICCLSIALACDVRNLFDESVRGSVKNFKNELKALNENLDLIRTKLQEKGTFPLDKEEECMAALEEVASTVTAIKDALDEVKSFHRAHRTELLYTTEALNALIFRLDDNRQDLEKSIYYGLTRASRRARNALNSLDNHLDVHFSTKQQVNFPCNDCTAGSMELKLPSWEKEPQYCLQPRKSRHHSTTIPLVLCLAYSKTLGPLWHWLLLVSLHVESKSSLSERIERNLPELSGISTILENTDALTFSMLLVSITCMILSASLLLRNSDNKARALITTMTLFQLALAGSQWGSLGGSALEFFMLYMPFALSTGCSLGLAVRHRKGCRIATLDSWERNNPAALLTPSRLKNGDVARVMVPVCKECPTKIEREHTFVPGVCDSIGMVENRQMNQLP